MSDKKLVCKFLIYCWCLFFLAATGTTGCGFGGKREIVKYQTEVKETLSSRSQPAKISSASEEELAKKGFLKLGSLNVEQTVKECWEDSQQCKSVQHGQDSTKVLLKQAADKGADWVVLLKNNAPGEKGISREGSCLSTRQQCGSVPVQQLDTTGKNLITTSKLRCWDVCEHFESISGTATLRLSGGTLWRKDFDKAAGYRVKKDFLEAIKKKDTQRVREILAGGFKVNYELDDKDDTPLHLAAREGNGEIVRLMIEHGADKNAERKRGDEDWTPIMDALEGNGEAFFVLLEEGSNLNIRERYWGVSLLYLANDSGGNPEVVSWLIKQGADVNGKSDGGDTALHRAALRGFADSVRILIKHGAGVNVQGGKIQYTPLHWAADEGHAEIVKLLLDSGADPSIKNYKGKTALNLAVSEGHAETVKILRNRGAE